MIVVTAVLFVLPAASATAAIKITKIQYEPPFEGTRLNREFVVIKNTGSARVNLTDWSLRNTSGDVFTFLTFRLHSGARVTIHTGQGNDDRNDLFWDASEYIWDSDGDTAILRNDVRDRRDRCHYSGGGTVTNC
jgi:hypothetical protein